jgi:DNA (cytosine-5)-methyltransferase 1
MRVLDLYCGAGGFSEGFKKAGFDIALGIDNWPVCERTFTYNHPGAKFWLENIPKNVNTATGIKYIQNEIEYSDIVIGSPPCVDFSTVNRERDPDKGLEHVEAFLEIVRILNPKYWIMENTHYAEKYIKKIVGRKVRSIVLNAADFGVPQIRKRVFFGNFPPPDRTHSSNPGQKILTSEGTRILSPWTNLESVLEKNVCYGFLTPKQEETAIRLKTRRETNQGTKITPIAYPDRLDRPSRTIMASIAMSNRSTIIVAPDGLPRTITSFERARIQGFDESFKWFGADTHIKKQMGNAVCPPVSYALAMAIKKSTKMEVSSD